MSGFWIIIKFKKMNKKFSAIIPLRAWSKRIKNKNTILLNWKPLFTYTLDYAIKSKYIDKIIISTDDNNVIEIINKNYQHSLNNKIKIINRKEEYSNDKSSTIDLIINDIFKKTEILENIILLQATSPLRTNIDIDLAIEQYKNNSAESLVSITKTKELAYWQYKINNCLLKPIMWKKYFNIRSQDLPETYLLNWAIYITSKENLLKYKSFLTNNMIWYIMTKNSSIDIDEIEDLKYCEFLLTNF